MPKALLAVAVAAIVLAGGCRSLTGRTMGRWADDQTITARVKERLGPLETNAPTRVNIDTFEGTVYMSGVVDSEATKRRLEQEATGVEAVGQVVMNVTIRSGLGAASPPLTGITSPAPAGIAHPLLSYLTGLARIDGDALAHPEGPYLAWDPNGRLVATIYTVSMRRLAQQGLDNIIPGGRPVDHVSIYPIANHPDVPEPEYHVVLWHVGRADAAALR